MLVARVHNFHVRAEEVEEVTEAVDIELLRLSDHPLFRGLLFLERGDDRREIIAITLWEAADPSAIERESRTRSDEDRIKSRSRGEHEALERRAVRCRTSAS